MKSLILDAGPVISLTTNNLLWILEPLKRMFDGQFIIPDLVKMELIDKPLQSKKFKFEALQVGYLIREGTLEATMTPQTKLLAEELLELANHSYKTKGNWIRIVHPAEMEVLSTAITLNSSAVVIDERTTRLLIEKPSELASMLERQMGSKVFTNPPNLNKIHQWTKNIKLIRSVELVMMAYEAGLFNNLLPAGNDASRTLVESILWGIKIHGCAISRDELYEIVRIETETKI